MTKPDRAPTTRPSLVTRSLSLPAFAAVCFAYAAGCGGSDAAPPSSGGSGAGAAAGAAAAGQAGSAASGGSSGAASAGAASAGAPSAGAAAIGGAAGALAGGAGGAPGTAGSAGNAGAAGGGAVSCAHKLCEDFETGTSGAIPTSWTKYKGYGAGSDQDAVLATDQFHSGKMALKSSSMATGQGRIQKSLSALGATASKHWGRIFYKVQSPATKPASGVLHVTWVGLLGASENRVVDIVEDTNGAHQWLYNNPDDNGGLGSAYDWTFDDAWHCAEWYIDVSAKQYRFFSDATEVTSIGFTGKNDAQMSNYTAIIVGATFYQMPPAPFTMWFDDLAIDDTQIGCQ